MEPGDPGRPPYFHHPPPPRHPHHHHHQQPPTTTTNGMLPSTTADTRPSQMLYPHNSAPSAVSSALDTAGRRKRGRPRKYSTPEQAAAAKRLPSYSTSPSTAVPLLSPASKISSLGNAGQGFTPHIITVIAGEDINHKIMLFMGQNKKEICILSASGSISNATLRQPATSGGNITYEGRFSILSLCGSYVRSNLGGGSSSTGGLSVCLSSNDGQIVGGSVDGPLIALGPVQVILGAFVIGSKNTTTVTKVDASTNPLASPTTAASVPSLSFLSAPDSLEKNTAVGNDDQRNIDGYQFMIPNRAMPVASPRIPEWRINNDSRAAVGYDFSGRVNHSQENTDYNHFQD